MGDIADGMINGDFDSITGEYIGDGAGFPRTLTGNNEGDNSRHLAYLKCKNLIIQWKVAKTIRLAIITIEDYAKKKEWKNTRVGTICAMITATKESWNEFKEYLKENGAVIN
jgi:hypothetical protein